MLHHTGHKVSFTREEHEALADAITRSTPTTEQGQLWMSQIDEVALVIDDLIAKIPFCTLWSWEIGDDCELLIRTLDDDEPANIVPLVDEDDDFEFPELPEVYSLPAYIGDNTVTFVSDVEEMVRQCTCQTGDPYQVFAHYFGETLVSDTRFFRAAEKLPMLNPATGEQGHYDLWLSTQITPQDRDGALSLLVYAVPVEPARAEYPPLMLVK